VTISSDGVPSLQEIITTMPEGLNGIFEEISNGITITDEHSKVIYVNPAFTTITGYQAKEIIGDNPGVLHSGRHDKSYYEHMWKEIITSGRWQGEIWNRRKSGEIVPELLTITKIVTQNNKVFYIGVFSDISFLVQENEKKINLALHDPLTGLCNRSLLMDRFDVIMHQYKRDIFEHRSNTKQVAFLFIDLDRFKKLNDTYGHLVGDSILVFVAQVLTTCSRSSDTVARVGGDEFAVILSDIIAKEEVENYCTRVREALSLGKEVNGLLLIPELSIGVSFFPSEATDFDTLTAHADKAMYHSKRNSSYLTFYSKLPGELYQ
jgi:diguanylate cyclase (GGDEF)-like protein/PAS domain S-box-containing protein